MQLPVQLKGAIEWIHLEEIIHIQTVGNGKLLFHTGEQSFYPLRTFFDWSKLIASDGQFVQVDRGNLINLKHVIGYDDFYDLVKLRHAEKTYDVPVAQSQICMYTVRRKKPFLRKVK